MKVIFWLLVSVTAQAHARPRPAFRWVNIRDGYALHRVYVNTYGNAMGDYYRPKPATFQVPVDVPKYTAQCYEGKPFVFSTESEAREFVLACPVY